MMPFEKFFSDLDIHFARFMVGLSRKEDNQALLLGAALASRATGEGHVCVDLAEVEHELLIDEAPRDVQDHCPSLSEWICELESCTVIGRPGEYKPLILDDRSRLYLYRYWEYEQHLADRIKKRATGEIEDVDLQVLGSGLSRLFPHQESGTDWQKVAAFASLTKRYCVISGGPGTGKSVLIAKILDLIMEQDRGKEVRIALAAPTGKAAARLTEAMRTEGVSRWGSGKEAVVPQASTLHRVLGHVKGSPYFRHNRENPLSVDTLVVDEASMVDLALMSKLMEALPPHCRLILLGDKDQLASVEAGAVLADICEASHVDRFSSSFSKRYHQVTGETIDSDTNDRGRSVIMDCVVELKKSYRFPQESGIGKMSRAINRGDGDLALSLLKDDTYQEIQWRKLPTTDQLYRELRGPVLDGLRPFLQAQDPEEALFLFGRFSVLSAVRRGPYGVSALNRVVERILEDENLIRREKPWYRGRPVMVTTNDYDLGLYNGDIGVILPDPLSEGRLQVFFLSPGGAVRKFSPIRLPAHETVYAMTVHKSQGSEFDEVLLVLPDRPSPVLTRELIYTGLTRAREKVSVWGRPSVFLFGVSRRTRRRSGLRDVLRT
ncbi:MAG: exodeoxyribonuclease V subunit alpha [Thermodesulfobacteriota bacterium]|nr:exodeoxyribonuclease V subunit alpha [Thermodesulfobacteriota bacterium]